MALETIKPIKWHGAFALGVMPLEKGHQVMAVNQRGFAAVDGLEAVLDPCAHGLDMQPCIRKQGADFIQIIGVPVPDAVMGV